MTTAPLALLAELDDVGVHVSDLWELVNGESQFVPALPVLLDWLQHVDSRVDPTDQPKVREALVRALSVPAARPTAAPVMIEQFRRVDDPSGLGPRWVIGNALSVVADDSVFDDLELLVQDRGYGKARQMIVLGMGQSKNPRAVPLLLDLLADDDVAAHAVMALGKLKAREARPALESMLDHRQALVRREAKKALAKLPG